MITEVLPVAESLRDTMSLLHSAAAQPQLQTTAIQRSELSLPLQIDDADRLS